MVGTAALFIIHMRLSVNILIVLFICMTGYFSISQQRDSSLLAISNIDLLEGVRATRTSQQMNHKPFTAKVDVAELLLEVDRAFAEADGNLQKLDSVLTRSLPLLVLTDPWAVTQCTDKIPNGEVREETLRRIAMQWAAQDAAGAEKWAAEMANPIEREVAISDCSLAISASDPQAAIQLRERYSLDAYSSSALENVTQRWAKNDLSAALKWTTALPVGEKRDAMISSIAFVASESQPAAAALLVSEEISPGETQNEAVLAVLHRWAKDDPAAAKAWIELFPDVPLRTTALAELARLEALRRGERAGN